MCVCVHVCVCAHLCVCVCVWTKVSLSNMLYIVEGVGEIMCHSIAVDPTDFQDDQTSE